MKLKSNGHRNKNLLCLAGSHATKHLKVSYNIPKKLTFVITNSTHGMLIHLSFKRVEFVGLICISSINFSQRKNSVDGNKTLNSIKLREFPSFSHVVWRCRSHLIDFSYQFHFNAVRNVEDFLQRLISSRRSFRNFFHSQHKYLQTSQLESTAWEKITFLSDGFDESARISFASNFS